MKDKSILIRLSEEEYNSLNAAYKQELINNDLVSRSEFIRQLLKKALVVSK